MSKYPKWAVIGRLAAIALRPVGDGSKLVRENQLAASLGLSRPTLRHYRDAVENVRGIGDWALRQRLLHGTAVAANTIVRWLRRDAASALTFLAQNPTFTDARIIAAARKASSTRSEPNWASLPLAALMADVAQWGGYLNPGLSSDRYAVNPEPWRFRIGYAARKTDNTTADFLGIEFELVQTSAPISELEKVAESEPARPEERLVAAMAPIPKFVLLERYRQEAKTIWTRLVAASLLYPIVVAVFPGPAARRYFATGIPADIRASWTGQERIAGDRRARCRSQLVSFRPAPQSGQIVLSTRPGLAVDLFEQAREYDTLPGVGQGH